jgi:hypothetical protein
MRHLSVAVAALLAVALIAFVAWTARQESFQEHTQHDQSIDGATVQTLGAAKEVAPAVEDGSREDAAFAEVRAMSQTFRNGSLLVAIRRAGFYCDEVVAADESADGVWLASCMDRRGYALIVRSVNQFDVRPIAHYFDSVFGFPPVRNEPFRLDRDIPPERLEPERLK